jgi:peroxiredoxin
MIELGELEGHHAEFERRHTRVIVASSDGLDDATEMKRDFQHLDVVADPERKLLKAAGMLHSGAGPGGEDVAAPTIVLIDRQGTVRWLHRPPRVSDRLSADEVLAAVDANLPATQ